MILVNLWSVVFFWLSLIWIGWLPTLVGVDFIQFRLSLGLLLMVCVFDLVGLGLPDGCLRCCCLFEWCILNLGDD